MLAYTCISPGKFELIDKPKPELQSPRASSATTLARWRNTTITNSAASPKRQSTLGVMNIGRSICNEPTMPAAGWRSSKGNSL